MTSDDSNRSLAVPDPTREPIPQGFALTVLDYSRRLADPEVLANNQRIFKGYVAALSGRGKEKKELQAAQLFVEVRLGELLGPHPGPTAGPGRGKTINTDNGLSPEMVHALRSLAWNPNGSQRSSKARRKIRDGVLSRSRLITELDTDYHKAQSDEDDDDEIALDIRHGDFREVLAELPDESVDLILTDPPYAVEYLDLWSHLGEFAATKLKPGASLIAYSGQSTLYEAHARLAEHLRYWWTLSIAHGQSQRLPGKWVLVGWKPILWFVKGHNGRRTYVADKLSGSGARTTEHEWAQGSAEVQPLINSLTDYGGLVVDPMAGSGSFGYAAVDIGRQFIGAEIRDSVAPAE